MTHTGTNQRNEVLDNSFLPSNQQERPSSHLDHPSAAFAPMNTRAFPGDRNCAERLELGSIHESTPYFQEQDQEQSQEPPSFKLIDEALDLSPIDFEGVLDDNGSFGGSDDEASFASMDILEEDFQEQDQYRAEESSYATNLTGDSSVSHLDLEQSSTAVGGKQSNDFHQLNNSSMNSLNEAFERLNNCMARSAHTRELIKKSSSSLVTLDREDSQRSLNRLREHSRSNDSLHGSTSSLTSRNNVLFQSHSSPFLGQQPISNSNAGWGIDTRLNPADRNQSLKPQPNMSLTGPAFTTSVSKAKMSFTMQRRLKRDLLMGNKGSSHGPSFKGNKIKHVL